MSYYGQRTVWQSLDLVEIWRFRSLIIQFALRDLKVRYRQTVVGALWAIIQPVVTMVVFGVLFSMLNGQPTASEIPYAVTSLAGLLPWQFFAASILAATQSISSNAQLVQKVYFPKIILPIAALLPPLADFMIASCVLGILMAFYGVVPPWQVLCLPFMLIYLMGLTLVCSLWFSAMNALFRDWQYVVPFLVSIGLLISPVTYELPAALESMSPISQFLYSLNPFAGMLSCFRWCLLGTPFPDVLPVLVSSVIVLACGVGGLIYFGRVERQFSDRV